MRDEKPLVVVVEDDHDSMTLNRMILRADYDVVACASAAMCRQAFQSSPRPPAAVILDLLLGAEDGLELAAWIRANHPRPDVAILAVTADHARFKSARSLPDVFDGSLFKPFDRHELLAALAAAIARRRAGHD